MREEDEFVDVAIDCLEALGLQAGRISKRNGGKTPDIRATDDASTYIIEVKVKNENEGEVEERRTSLKETGKHSSVKETGYMSSYNSVIDDAASQLREYESRDEPYRLVWLEYTGLEQRLMHMRFRGTLYGSVQVIELSTERVFECIFFDHSAFYRNRDVLDAAILTHEGRKTFWINPLSPKARKIKDSLLCAGFGSSVFDPEMSERSGETLIVDADFPRKDEARTLEYARNKYRLSTIVSLRPKQFSSEAIVRKPKACVKGGEKLGQSAE